MADRRVARAVAGLGDVFTPSGLKIPTVCTPSTDFRADVYGRLRGYLRLCNPGGAFISVPKNGCTPEGPTPTSEEWRAIDEQRRALGLETIRCLVTKKSSNFLDVAARRTAVVTAPLDRYVPGWATAADLILSPLVPILPLLLGALSSAIDVASSGVGSLIPAQLVAGGGIQQTLAHQVLDAGRVVAQAGVQGTAILGSALTPIGLTLAKATATAKTTRGNLAKRIAAVSLEITQGLALTASIAGGVFAGVQALATIGIAAPGSGVGFATVLSADTGLSTIATGLPGQFSALTVVNGAPVSASSFAATGSLATDSALAFGTVRGALDVVKTAAETGVRVAAAKEAADAAKRGARLARQAAEAQHRALVEQSRALDAEIARLERQIAAARPAPRTVAPMPAMARAAAPVQMSNGTRALLAGALALALAEVLE